MHAMRPNNSCTPIPVKFIEILFIIYLYLVVFTVHCNNVEYCNNVKMSGDLHAVAQSILIQSIFAVCQSCKAYIYITST